MAQGAALASTGSRNSRAGVRAGLAAVMPPLVGGLALLLALIGLIGTALHDPRPHDIPVGLVGPSAATGQLEHGFASAAPGAFTFTQYDSEEAARAAIDARSVAGALVLGPAGPRLVVAGAAGDAVSGVITAVFANAFRA